MEKLSIVHVIDILNTGGAERVLTTLANLQYNHGHTVKVITTVSEGPLKTQLNKGIDFLCLHRKLKWNPFTMKALVKEIKGFDIIHVHSSYNLRYVFLAGKIFGLRKTIFFHEHFGDINMNPKVYWHQRFIYPQTIFIGVSRQLTDWAVGKLGMSPQKVFALPNTVIKQANSTQSFKVGSSIRQLVIASNFRPTKNLAFTLTVLEALQIRNNEKYHLTIIGKIADHVYYAEVTEMIKTKGLQNHTTLIHDCDNIQPLLGKFHLALHTALSESGPLVLIEYLAQHIPFVAYNTGEVAAQIINDVPECFTHSFDVEEWLIKIECLLSAATTATQSKMDRVFDKHFSAQTYYSNCIAIYKAGLSNTDRRKY